MTKCPPLILFEQYQQTYDLPDEYQQQDQRQEQWYGNYDYEESIDYGTNPVSGDPESGEVNPDVGDDHSYDYDDDSDTKASGTNVVFREYTNQDDYQGPII